MSAESADPYLSEKLAAEIREALAAVQRGETVDLGSFARYAEPDGAGEPTAQSLLDRTREPGR